MKPLMPMEQTTYESFLRGGLDDRMDDEEDAELEREREEIARLPAPRPDLPPYLP